MPSELRGLTLWAVYASSLVVAFGSAHALRSAQRPPPPPPDVPSLSVAPAAADLDQNGQVNIQFRLDRPAATRVRVQYRLEPGEARRGRDFAVEPESSSGTVVIEPGESNAAIILRRLAPGPTTADGPRTVRRRRAITLTVSEGVGFQLAAGAARSWEFPLTTTEFGPPYQISARSPSAFKKTDAREGEPIDVVFELDRAPTERPVSTRYRLGGDAKPTDYEVVDRPKDDDTLLFPVGQRVARLKLKRLPGRRGLGDRTIRVDYEPPAGGELTLAPGQGPVLIVVPDPPSRLTWSVDPPKNRDPRNPSTAQLNIVIQPPPSEPFPFRYRVLSPNRADLLSPADVSIVVPAPADPWAVDRVPLTRALEFPPDDFVLAAVDAHYPALRGRVESTDGLADPARVDFDVHDADEGDFTGHVLVILVMTEGLTRDDPAARRELQAIQAALDQAEAKGVRGLLIDRSIFVWDGDKRLYRFRLEAIKNRKPFSHNAKIPEVVNKEFKQAVGRLLDRLSEEDTARFRDQVLLIRDVADDKIEPVIKALKLYLPGQHWWVYWIDPETERSPLGRFDTVDKIRSGADLDAFGAPIPDLPSALLRFLR